MLSELRARLRSLWHGMRRRDAVEAEMNEEFQLHIEMRARDLEHSGLSSAVALLQARREFGMKERFKEEGRESRGLHRLDVLRFSWLDIKLGTRMMIKYPGLTVIAGLGMAVAIAIGTGYNSAIRVLLATSLPLPEGDRIVALQNWDTRNNHHAAGSIHDFVTWRNELKSVQEIGAYRTITRNLVSTDGAAEPVAIAEMSASGFRVARVQPVLGRYLVDADEEQGATPVVVIGYDVWRRRYAADSSIVGRDLRLGTRMHTVVGVMPERFGFPVNHHFWIPLRADPNAYQREDGPAISVFGRLAPGETLAHAGAELEVIGRRTRAAFPETHDWLRAQVQPYARPVAYMDQPDDVQGARLLPLLTTLLLVVICVNVAVLIYARTAIRHGEIVVRTALGASRRRVIAQLFAEALVLALVAAAAGLSIAGFALHQANFVLASIFGGQLPFWMDFNLSVGSIVFAVALAVLAAVITGVLPALKATGSRLQNSLQQLSAGGGSSRLGRAWTAMIIGQVAVTVALLPFAVFQAAEMFRYGTVNAGFAADEYVSAVVEMESMDQATQNARYTNRASEMMQTLRGERGISGVTLASAIPGKERDVEIEVEGHTGRTEPNASTRTEPVRGSVRFALVDVSYFDVFDVAALAGRSFTAGDADSSATAVIVNRSFVKQYAADGQVLGLRVRRLAPREGNDAEVEAQPQRWYEIVGVIPDFPSAMIPEQIEEKVYQAASPAQMYPAILSVRLRAGEASVGTRLRQVAAALDPALQIRNIRTLDRVYADDQSALRLTGFGIAVVTLSVLLLSSAGIYAMMSLAVTRRRREIAIRAALGAKSRHILANVFARASTQLGVGIVAGFTTSLLVDQLALGSLFTQGPMVLPVVSAIVLAVGLLASIGPARRGLRIQPAEALKED